MQEALESMRNGMHSLLVSAMQIIADTGRAVCDGTDAVPWESTMALARQVWDTSRHIEIFLQLLECIEGNSGVAPETTRWERGACTETASAERTCGALVRLIALAQEIGDPVSERALDMVLADVSIWERKDQPYAVA